jgi:hypothetical protein
MMDQFVFRKHDNVGSAAAEHDSQFLDDCFVDTGDIKFLLDRNNPKRIIVGCQWPTELSHFRPLILSHFSREKSLIQL